MKKSYTHFTESDRDRLYELIMDGMSKRDIAGDLGKDCSAVYREIKRNSAKIGYLPDKATAYYLSRRKKSEKLLEDIELQEKVIERLKNKFSPRQIYLYFKRNNGSSPISAESIYQFIYSERGRELELYKYLRRKHKKRKVRKEKAPKKISISNRTSIKQRPKDIDERVSFGHWEGDLMIFSNQKTNLITLRERKSRVMIAIKNETKASETTAENIINNFKGSNKKIFSSCTVDNGGEFAKHEIIAKKLEAPIYFCDPYSSYQKGAVEQGNGVIRVELPRNTDLENMQQKDINLLMKNINARPMELHDGYSPSEIFMRMAGDQVKGLVALQT